MLNPFAEIEWHPTRSRINAFGKTVAIGFVAIGAIIYAADLLGSEPGADLLAPLIAAGSGLLVGLLCRIAPKTALPLYWVWHAAGAAVGIVVSNLLLSCFYYLIFTPTALVYRVASGADPLRLKRTPDGKSEWIERKGPDSLARYLKQY